MALQKYRVYLAFLNEDLKVVPEGIYTSEDFDIEYARHRTIIVPIMEDEPVITGKKPNKNRTTLVDSNLEPLKNSDGEQITVTEPIDLSKLKVEPENPTSLN